MLTIKQPHYNIGDKIFDKRDTNSPLYTIKGMRGQSSPNSPTVFEWVYQVSEDPRFEINEQFIELATSLEIQRREIVKLNSELNTTNLKHNSEVRSLKHEISVLKREKQELENELSKYTSIKEDKKDTFDLSDEESINNLKSENTETESKIIEPETDPEKEVLLKQIEDLKHKINLQENFVRATNEFTKRLYQFINSKPNLKKYKFKIENIEATVVQEFKLDK